MKKNHRIQENGRFSAKRKTEAVLRLLRGEDLDLLSREYKITANKLSQWRDAFLPLAKRVCKKVQERRRMTALKSCKPKWAN